MKIRHSTYYFLITVGFGLIVIPTIYNAFFGASIQFFLSPRWISMFMASFIAFGEIGHIENKIASRIGYIACFVTITGILFKILHMPGADLFFMIGGITVCLILAIMLFVERKQDWIGYLLALYFIIWWIRVMGHRYDFIWLLELLSGISVFVAGNLYLWKPSFFDAEPENILDSPLDETDDLQH